MKKDFICLLDWTTEELKDMISLAREMKRNPDKYRDSLKGKTLGMIFSKNSTRTFLVRANVTGASSGDSVSVKMAGDSTHLAGATLMATAANVDADLHDDFIWTDKSLGSHAYTTADWTNGYLVEGLPGTSSTAQVISL